MAGGDGGDASRRQTRFAIRAVVAVLFVGAFVYMLVRAEWLAAAIIFPFAAAQVYFAVAVARGSDLGHRA
jgi:type IV secretory pathway TrbL component